MSRLDLIGVIGTWVGVGIGIVALLGVVGPLLVWRASKTERHKALAAIGKDNHGYISNGLPVWPGLRFLQRVKAPRLNKVRAFSAQEWKSFDLKRLKSIPESPATWVQFGAALEAYKVSFEIGDILQVVNSRSTLAVHQLYVRIFCVLGRYGISRKRGNINENQIQRPRISGAGQTPEDFLRMVTRGSRDSDLVEDYKLFGLTGTLNFRDENMTYMTDLNYCEKRIAAEKLPLGATLLLLEGFILCSETEYISIQGPVETSFDDESMSSSSRSRIRRRSGRNAANNRHARQRRISAGEQMRSDREFLCLQLTETLLTEEDRQLVHLPSSTSEKLLLWSVMSINSSNRNYFANLSDVTFVPATEPWLRFQVRVEDEDRHGPNEENVQLFLDRDDTQKLVCGLLRMPWHPEGYLIPQGIETVSPLHILTRLAHSAPRYLSRVKEGFKALELTGERRRLFLSAADTALEGFDKTTNLRQLDDLLEDFRLDNPPVYDMIGILVLSSVEFEVLVYQSVRYLDDIPEGGISCKLRTGELRIPSAFGIVQKFEVDPKLLQVSANLPGECDIKHSVILLAAMKAYLRSLMLTQCTDGNPLRTALDRHRDNLFFMS